ncbi:hypothetical protein BS410_22950 [Cronobacter sakazakii]|nr:hypothetical protein BS410_22950 [Cronobacter sakazakii]
MGDKEQREFIMKLCEQMRERQVPDLAELWRKSQEEYHRQLCQASYSNRTSEYRNGYSLYTY